MLDLLKLAQQLPGISEHLTQEAAAGHQRLESGQQLLQAADRARAQLVARHAAWRERLLFSAAIPLEPLGTRTDIPVPPKQHSVFATDGSQIAPSHHEIAYCYLINIGRVMLHYEQGLMPLLDSLPEVFYRAEDLYESRQWGIRIEDWMGNRRTVSELSALAEMACAWVEPPGPHSEPRVALVDGSLVYWFLENLPTDARDRLLAPLLEAFARLSAARIPLVGYCSTPRNTEATRFLRLQACPHTEPDCFGHCGDRHEAGKPFPCQVLDPLRDRTLWGHVLAPGQRGPLWRSSARILDLYDAAARVCFCYVHVGSEIARVEVPAWVAEDRDLFDRTLGIVLAQVHKGYGYPVALAEAHNQAVVRSGDRARFFGLLEQQMVDAGLQNVGTSYKEARKRRSIA